MSQATHIERERLQDIGKRLAKAVSGSATGPLLVAQEIVGMSEVWDERWRAEADGLDCTSWLSGLFANKAKGLTYWKKRARAVERLGEAIRRTLDHEVAAWMIEAIPDAQLDAAKLVLMRRCKQLRGIPLSKTQATIALRAAGLLSGAKHKTCSRCEQLERAMREAGVEIPE